MMESWSYIILMCVSVYLTYGQTNEKQPQDSSCSSPLCSCCLDTVQCPAAGQCGGQCKDGYFAGKCLTICPDNCVRCQDPYNPTNDPRLWAVANCTACKDGHYSTTEYFQCQFTCPDGCQTCTSATECTSCKPGYTLEGTTCKVCKTGCALCSSYDYCTQCQTGYYNSGGVTGNLNCVECSKGCNDQCDNTTGTCTCYTRYTGNRCDSCASGYYKNGEYCSQCTYPCLICTSAITCTSCAVGYYLNGDNCQQCNTGCAQCSSGGNCDKCKDYYYYYNSGGVAGNLNCVRCGGGCKDDQCDPATGNCTCRTQWHIVPKCDGCIDGHYMSSQKYCYQCRVSYCAKCTSQDTCTSCVDGYFDQGTACQACRPECAQCSTYDNCTDCNDRYYKNGTGCVSCSTGCSDVCNKATGTCNCKKNYSGEKCDRCVDGKHGTYCNLNCSSGCQICSSATQCSVCQQGKYGDTCDKICPKNCLGQICDKTNGTCITCNNGFQGDSCTVPMTSKDGPDVDESFKAAIAGGVVGGAVLIIVVMAIIVIVVRRVGVCCTSGAVAKSDEPTAHPTYINVAGPRGGSTQEAQINRKAIEDISNQINKCRQMEAKYSEKLTMLEFQLNELTGNQSQGDHSQDDVTSLQEVPTYEGLNREQQEDNPYASLGAS